MLSLCLIPFFRQAKGNFDPAHELEEILLEDNPLRAKRRTKDFETMSPEMKRMEEQCVSSPSLFVVGWLITPPDSYHTTSDTLSSSAAKVPHLKSQRCHTDQ